MTKFNIITFAAIMLLTGCSAYDTSGKPPSNPCEDPCPAQPMYPPSPVHSFPSK